MAFRGGGILFRAPLVRPICTPRQEQVKINCKRNAYNFSA